MAEHEFVKPLIKSFAVLRNAGFKTYGQWSDAESLAKARTFALVLADDSKITTEIIQATALRYAKGKVTVWSPGGDKPVDSEFPTAPQFRDACLQTWHELYRLVAIGEKVEDGVKVLVTGIERRAPVRPEALALEARATPEQIAAAKARIAALTPREMPAPTERASGRSERVRNLEAEAELERIRANIDARRAS